MTISFAKIFPIAFGQSGVRTQNASAKQERRIASGTASRKRSPDLRWQLLLSNRSVQQN
jgi:hypothetical protein